MQAILVLNDLLTVIILFKLFIFIFIFVFIYFHTIFLLFPALGNGRPFPGDIFCSLIHLDLQLQSLLQNKLRRNNSKGTVRCISCILLNGVSIGL